MRAGSSTGETAAGPWGGPRGLLRVARGLAVVMGLEGSRAQTQLREGISRVPGGPWRLARMPWKTRCAK